MRKILKIIFYWILFRSAQLFLVAVGIFGAAGLGKAGMLDAGSAARRLSFDDLDKLREWYERKTS